MFESASYVLSAYIPVVHRRLWRFDIYTVNAARGENPADLYYLCNVRGVWFVVCETDHFDSLRRMSDEVAEIFESHSIKPTGWVAKRKEDSVSLDVVPLDLSLASHYDELILHVEGTFLRCAVLAVEARDEEERRYDPLSYGAFAKQ